MEFQDFKSELKMAFDERLWTFIGTVVMSADREDVNYEAISKTPYPIKFTYSRIENRQCFTCVIDSRTRRNVAGGLSLEQAFINCKQEVGTDGV